MMRMSIIPVNARCRRALTSYLTRAFPGTWKEELSTALRMSMSWTKPVVRGTLPSISSTGVNGLMPRTIRLTPSLPAES